MSSNSVQNFLDMLVELARSNPSLKINYRLIYAQLVSFSLGHGSVPFENVEKYFRNWITDFQSNDAINVYRDISNPFICHFLSKNTIDNANNVIKLYVPLDSIHIKDGVIDLFSFLTRENIAHESKVLSSTRNDNIVIRLSKIDDVNKIVRYIKNNQYLSEGLLNANPFLVPSFKLGVIIDNTYTYNVEVAKVLAYILENLKKKDELDKFSMSYVKNIFVKLSVTCDDDELSELYKLASLALDEESTLQDFANYVIEYQQTSYTNKHGNLKISYNDSVTYFNTAILETFKRYNNLSFVINAVKLYLNTGNIKGFTRNNKARENLSLYVDREHIKSLFEIENLDFSIKYYLLKVITNDK